MEYNKLVAVSGLPGLYELINSKTDGAIIRSLSEKTTKFASSRLHQFSHLESIEIYTVGDNVNLVDLFKVMEKDTSALPDVKSDKAVKAYFEKVYPEMDFDRVYMSDMKKMVKWFDILKKNAVEIKLPELEEEVVEDKAEVNSEGETKEEPIKKKTPAKKTTAKKKAE
jgi:hypothetical protein